MNTQRSSRAAVWAAYAGWGCLVGAAAHVIGIIMGPDAIAFMGAPKDYVSALRAGDWVVPVGVTLGIAVLLCIWAAYAFSAAGRLPRLPLQRLVCALVAAVFLVRGLFFFPMLWWLTKVAAKDLPFMAFHTLASLFVLTLGLGFAFAYRLSRV